MTGRLHLKRKMEKTNTEYINQIAYDMIYLASFGINSKCKPDEKCLERYRTNEENRKELFRMSAKHFIDASLTLWQGT